MHIRTQLVVRSIMLTGVAVRNERNEPFLGFSLLVVYLTIGKKGELGELEDLEFMDWNNLSKVSGGFSGRTGLE